VTDVKKHGWDTGRGLMFEHVRFSKPCFKCDVSCKILDLKKALQASR